MKRNLNNNKNIFKLSVNRMCVNLNVGIQQTPIFDDN